MSAGKIRDGSGFSRLPKIAPVPDLPYEGAGAGVSDSLSTADSSLDLPDSSQARAIRPYPYPIRPFLVFVVSGRTIRL